MTIAALDHGDEPMARAALLRCCGAGDWVDAMLHARPFVTREGLHAAADQAFAPLAREAVFEAFSHHPRIGDLSELRDRFASTASWASGEQQGAAQAQESTLEALAAGNAAYEARFGHRFIVCATGLSAHEMLARLESRLHHGAEEELRIAAAEQLKITHLRLDKLLEATG